MATPVRVVSLIALLALFSTGAKAQPPPIVIGEYGSMTGSEAHFGQTTHRGIMLAIEQKNAAGGVHGRQLEVRVYDDQGKSQEVGTAVTRLITNDKVVAVLGEVSSSLSIAGARVAQQYGVPMISPSSTASGVTEVGDMISRACFVDAFQGYAAARFARDNLALSKAAVLYDQATPYSKELYAVFAHDFEAMGGQIVSAQAYSGGDSDYSAQLTSIRAANPEIIYVPGYYTDVGNIHLQARKLGVTQPLIGGDGWDSPELARIGGDTVNGSYFTSQYANEDQRPQVQAYAKAFREKYGETPDGLSALGYDAALVLIAALERTPSLDPKELARAIATTRDLDGVTGTITMDAHRNPVKEAVIVKLDKGEIVYAGRVRPQDPDDPWRPPTTERVDTTSSAGAGMSRLLQTLLDALAVGSLYALIALGYTMVYGILTFINFAHSDIFMTGAWVSLTLATGMGGSANVIVVLVAAMLVCGLMGFVIERFAYRPLRRAPRLNVLITAIGVSLLIQNVGQLPAVFGANPKRMPALIDDFTLMTVAGVQVRLVDVLVIALALTLMAGLQFLVFGTKLGRAMRAVAYDMRTASLMGIDVDRIVSLTFVIGSALAAAAGLLYATKYPGLNQPAHATWVLLGLKAFVAAVVGGIGNVRGAVAGGLLIGFVELFGAAYLSPHLRDLYVFALLIAVLLLKPTGILGRATVEKV